MRTILFLFISLLLNSPLWAEGTFRLGGIFDLSSGSGASWGNAEKNGFLMAITEFRKANPNFVINYSVEDSAYDNKKSISAFNKLTSIDGFKYILGPTWEPFLVVQPLCEKRKVLCISVSSNNGVFEDSSQNYSISMWVDERDYTRVIANRLNEDRDEKSVIIASNTPYHDLLVEALKNSLHVPALLIERFNPENLDFRSFITRLPKNLTTLVVLLSGEDALPIFAQQYAQIRKDRPKIYTDDYLLYAPRKELPKKLGFEVWYSAPNFQNEKFKEFARRYQTSYGEEPASPGAAVTYDATVLLLECMKLKGPEDPRLIEECIRNNPPYEGASGRVSLGGKRFAQREQISINKL